MDAYERVQLMKQELLDMLEELGPKLPPNTLDELIEELGGTDNVAEVGHSLDDWIRMWVDEKTNNLSFIKCHLFLTLFLFHETVTWVHYI